MSLTPFYEKDGITIYCGECSQVMAEILCDGCIDLTITSPPYDNLRDYEGYMFDFDPIAAQLWRVTKQGGVVVWIVADQTIDGSETGTSFRQALGFMSLGFNLHDTMIYEVAGTGAKGSNRAYWQGFEFMFILSKGYLMTVNRIADRDNRFASQLVTKGKKSRQMKTRLGRYRIRHKGIRTNVWRYHAGNNGTEQTDHPAVFPEALARDHIISWSNPGDLVLDPMVGSGTTLKMAHKLNRRAVGIEISEEYCRMAVERLRQRSIWSVLEIESQEVDEERVEAEQVEMELGGV